MLVGELERAGYAPEGFRNGLDFLANVDTGNDCSPTIDLLICDVRIPGVTGLSLLEELREWRPTHELPVILITAFGSPEVHARARKLGASTVLDKPFPISALLAAVARVVHPA